ncbi:MAG: hypothetical protein IPM01_11585 [Burkholderiaceae bacterium]|nr:hypothetical protein [Burkholderiaceae bacterium]
MTHFIEGLDPAGPSVRRCANLPPTGRTAQNARRRFTMSARSSAAKRSMTAGQPGIGLPGATARRAPLPLGHQFARQAEGQIEGADPGAIGLQPAIEGFEALEPLQRMHPD